MRGVRARLTACRDPTAADAAETDTSSAREGQRTIRFHSATSRPRPSPESSAAAKPPASPPAIRASPSVLSQLRGALSPTICRLPPLPRLHRRVQSQGAPKVYHDIILIGKGKRTIENYVAVSLTVISSRLSSIESVEWGLLLVCLIKLYTTMPICDIITPRNRKRGNMGGNIVSTGRDFSSVCYIRSERRTRGEVQGHPYGHGRHGHLRGDQARQFHAFNPVSRT